MEVLMYISICLYAGTIFCSLNETYMTYKHIEEKGVLSKDHLWEHIIVLGMQGILKIGILLFVLIQLDMETMLKIQAYIPLIMASVGYYMGVLHFRKEREGKI